MGQEGYNRVTITIGGQQLTLRTTKEPQYIRELAEFVDQRFATVAGNNPRLSTSQRALLTAINIADELFRATKGGDK